VTQIPARAERIERQTRKLIEDAEKAAAMHDADLTEFARQLLAGRRQRDRYFDPMLFSNPAWDILLNLYVADAEGKPMSLLDSCTAAIVPQGVALRWLGYLRQEEMVMEVPDPARPRHMLVRLSGQARLTISSYLGSLVSLGLGPEPAMPDIPPARG